jgi:hypothetical protein
VSRVLWPGGEAFNVVAAGSNMQRQALLFDRFKEAVLTRCPTACVMRARGEAADGACTYVLQVLHREANVAKM